MNEAPTHIAVAAAHDGFRRAGRAWHTTPETVPVAEFTVEQLDALKADPSITVTPVADPEAAPQGRAERLQAGIARLNRDDPAHWTKSGKPEVGALRAAARLGDISAAERDAAWEAFDKAQRG